MTENNELDKAIPNAEEEKTAEEIKDTTPNTESAEIFVPVKFNKEIKKLSIDEASQLAQKGMKFDVLREDYNTLKLLANQKGKSITEFLEMLKLQDYEQRRQELAEKCGGDFSLAEHILSLEQNKNFTDTLGFEELKKEFPRFKTPEELPQEVLENARLKGSMLLDEYLRYRLAENKRIKLANETKKATESASLGSQINREGAINPETAEFLKGLWR